MVEPLSASYSLEESYDLIDCKAHAFNAGAPIILVCKGRLSKSLPKKACYDSWRLPSLCEGDSETFECLRFPRLDDALRNGIELACGFGFVRVDWHEADGRLCFGEASFALASGAKRLVPLEWSVGFGRRIDLDGKPIDNHLSVGV